MSLLTVDVGGANETTIRFARAGHAEPKSVGTRRYAFAGNERSMMRGESHVIPLVLAGDYLAADVATLRSLFALGAEVVCSGDVFNNGGAAVTCMGELSDEMEVGGTRWIPTLTLTQVTGTLRGTLRASVAPAGLAVVSATLIGFRRGTIASAGLSTVTVTARSTRANTVAAAGVASVAVVLRRKSAASASGAASVTATGSVL
jgi:hypothetical protein